MNWSSFKYLVKQGWHNMVANRLMTVASLGVLTACLVITGIAGILSVSVSNFVQSLGDKDMIEVFISDEATDEQIEAWSQQLPQLANVASCTFISKAQAVEDMKGNRLLLFTSDWAVRWAETHNETLKLSEFGNI